MINKHSKDGHMVLYNWAHCGIFKNNNVTRVGLSLASRIVHPFQSSLLRICLVLPVCLLCPIWGKAAKNRLVLGGQVV